ncbi:phosphopyruvate hydratase [Variovorax sp. J22R133]|uniref:phosphopyruvate hydratase n=1 Tax=Variovorax brevis TaxID=3053503 RepID=UPI0025755090|nr:phosphopyruvate hydratase [Variovorax sp. J22R133]MDM0113147.1 phosphopyruvate hydratase [Variovorax sp. J22R133]
MSTLIRSVLGRRIWDSRGRPTVEVDVTLANGARGRGVAPAGASRGSREAVDLRDGGVALGGFDVSRALANVNGPIAQHVVGLDAMNQQLVDDTLVALDATPNKSALGGNATIAVSLAVLHAAAASAGLPLWRYLAGDGPVRMPLPEIQIFGGGAHAGRRVDVQDFLIMPIGAATFDEAMVMTAEVYRAAGELMDSMGRRAGVADEGGWWPNFKSNEEALETLVRAIDTAGYRYDQVAISLDIAASEFGREGRYTLGLEQRTYDTGEWLDVLTGWVDRYPILSIEDPVAEDDAAGMKAFTEAVGQRIQIIGDDFLVTNAALVRDAIAARSCNAVLLKPNQAGTVSETRAAMEVARAAGWGMVVSARSGETEDVAIVHLATGWNTGQLKVGSFARSERMAKWNEGLRIEAEIGASAVFAGRSALPLAAP